MIPEKRLFLLIPEVAEAAPVEAVVQVAVEDPVEEVVQAPEVELPVELYLPENLWF